MKLKGLTLTQLAEKAREISSRNASFNTTQALNDGVYEFIKFDEDDPGNGATPYFVAVFKHDGKDVAISLWELAKDPSAPEKGIYEIPFGNLSAFFTEKVAKEFEGKWEISFKDLTLTSRKGSNYTHRCVVGKKAKKATKKK